MQGQLKPKVGECKNVLYEFHRLYPLRLSCNTFTGRLHNLENPVFCVHPLSVRRIFSAWTIIFLKFACTYEKLRVSRQIKSNMRFSILLWPHWLAFLYDFFWWNFSYCVSYIVRSIFPRYVNRIHQKYPN
jgi:hypothetical protein